jgi:hypothetical protein
LRPVLQIIFLRDQRQLLLSGNEQSIVASVANENAAADGAGNDTKAGAPDKPARPRPNRNRGMLPVHLPRVDVGTACRSAAAMLGLALISSRLRLLCSALRLTMVLTAREISSSDRPRTHPTMTNSL